MSLERGPRVSSAEKKGEKGLPLEVFDPEQGVRILRKYTQEAAIVPSCKEKSVFGDFVVKAEREKSPARVQNKEVRTLMHESISAFYGLTPEGEDPEAFFQRQMGKAHKQVSRIVDTFFPGREDLKGVDEAIQVRDLVTVTHQILSPETSSRLRHELKVRLALGLLEAEVEKETQGGKERLIDVRDLFNEKLFTNDQEAQEECVYAIHDNETNQVHAAPQPRHPAPFDYISTVQRYGLPITDLPYNTHVKGHPYWARKVEDVGNVQIKSRIKETVSSKAVRKAIQSEQRGRDTSIQPTKGVPDVFGMQFVAMEELSIKSEGRTNKIEKLMSKVKKVLEDKYGKDVQFTTKDQTSAEFFQGTGFKGKRLMVSFSDEDAPKAPIEMWFHGIEDDINNRYNIGKKDQKSGKQTDYSAHEVMEIDRGLITAKKLFPEEIYGRINWDAVEVQTYKRVIHSLKEQGRMSKPDALQALREVQQEHTRKRRRY